MTKQLRMMTWPVKLPSNYFTGFLMINHPPVEGACTFGWGKPYEKRDDQFLSELCDYFQNRIKTESLEPNSVVWGAIVPTHAEFIELLETRNYEKLHEYLRFMWTKPLTYGIAQGEFFYQRLQKNEEEIQKNTGFAIYDKFLTLMESVGLIPAFSAEQFQSNSDFLKYYSVDVDRYLDELEEHLKCKIVAPPYQGSHFGIQTERHGVFSDRDIMSLGVAIRILESYWNRPNITIADVGSGLGYLLYYLNLLGFKNLTHIDIPTVTVGAKYFMKTNAPDLNVNFITPNEFDGKYDLVVNIDGMSSFNKEVAETYANKISQNAKHFLSVNREFDEFRVYEIMNMRRITRNPFWLRRGYIEEDYLPENKND